MRVRNLIKELQELNPDEFIAVSYWTQENMKAQCVDYNNQLTEDEWEEVTDNLTYELENFEPDSLIEFFIEELLTIRQRKDANDVI